ncbi:MAG: HEAT repeat domain-containing protein [Deltaproteobacteria bacterium]|nr:HEAT repeat domain-containing protein [Deltaproteobacteria bacterium]
MDKKTRSIIILCAVLFLSITGYLYISPLTSDEKKAETALNGPEKTLVIAVDQQAQKQKTVKSGEITPLASDKDSDRIEAASAAVNNEDISAKFRAILSLRQELSQEAIDILLRFLHDKDGAVVSEAIDTLGFIGSNNSDLKDLVFRILEEKAKDKNFAAAGHALITAAILTEDNRILPVILDYVSEENEVQKAFAARAMSFIATPECIAPLKVVLEGSDDPQVHRNAFNILARIDTPEAIDLLQQYMLSKDEDKQARSAWALSRQNKKEHNEILIEAIANHSLPQKGISVVASSPAAHEVFGTILQRYDTEKKDKIFLLKLLADNAWRASADVRSGIVGSVLIPLLDSEDTDLVIDAIKALGKMGTEENTLDVLIPKLQSENFLVQENALGAFAKYCTPRTYKPLLDLYWDDDEKIRRGAFVLSERFLNSSDIEVLKKAANHSDEFISKQSKTIMDQILQ